MGWTFSRRNPKQVLAQRPDVFGGLFFGNAFWAGRYFGHVGSNVAPAVVTQGGAGKLKLPYFERVPFATTNTFHPPVERAAVSSVELSTVDPFPHRGRAPDCFERESVLGDQIAGYVFHAAHARRREGLARYRDDQRFLPWKRFCPRRNGVAS